MNQRRMPILVPAPQRSHIITIGRNGKGIEDDQRQLICSWLAANGIDPNRVSADQPITLELHPSAVVRPYLTPCTGPEQAFWLIGFMEHYVNNTGHKEVNLRTGGVVQFERTVPMTAMPPQELADLDIGDTAGAAA